MAEPEQELIQLAQLDIGLAVALETADEAAVADLRANQKLVQQRMRSVQNEITRRGRTNRDTRSVPRGSIKP